MTELSRSARRKTAARALDPARLEELALAYVARFATTAAKLERYLLRKLRERDWNGDNPPDVAGLVARFAENRYVDDAGWSDLRARGLLARGYGPRRIAAALREGGVAENVRAANVPGDGAVRQAALLLARRRGFGPFGTWPADADACRKARQKQLAAMLRAGHDFDTARFVLEAHSTEDLEQWAATALDGD